MPPGELNKLDVIYWRDEILQLMYWMEGEGFGREFALADLQKFIAADDSILTVSLLELVTSGFLAQVGDNFALTAQGKKEGGRRFADEFEEMLKPGHFECNEPDCDCHDPNSVEGACKHLFDAHESRQGLVN